MQLPTQESLLQQTNNKSIDGLPSTGISIGGSMNLPSQEDLNSISRDTNPALPGSITTPIKREDYEPILKSFRPELGIEYLDEARALSQGNATQLSNALWQSAEGTLIGETLQGIGALGELPEMVRDVVKGTNDADFNNFMMEWGDKVIDHSKKVAPIYRENPGKDLDFGDWAYWMDNIPSVFSSLSLLIPAVGFEKAGSLALAKAAKVLGVAEKVGESTKYWTKLLSTAAFMRNGENVMEAHSLYKQSRQDVLDRLDTNYEDVMNDEFMQSEDSKELRQRLTGDKEQDKEVIANYIASKASWTDYKMNSMNYAFDVMQLMPLFKGFPLKTRANSWLNISDDVAKVVGQSFTKSQKIARTLYPLGVALGEQLSEGVEEAINGISQKEAEYQYGRELGTREESSGAKRFGEYMGDKNVADQALWGFLGGVAFSGIARGVGKFSPSAKAKIDQSQIQLGEITTRQAVIGEYYNNLQKIKGKVASKAITPEQAKDEFNTNKAILAANLGFSAAQAGNVDLLLQQINSKEFKEGILKSYTADDLKEIGIEDIDKSIQHMTEDVLTTEKLYKKAYNTLFTKNIAESIKSKAAHSSVMNGFVAERLRYENNELENHYSKLVSEDDYFKDSEDTAHGTIQLKALRNVINNLTKQKVRAQILLGNKSYKVKTIRKKLDTYIDVFDKLNDNIGKEAGLKGMNPKIQETRNKILWNEVSAKDADEVAKDLLSDKSLKKMQLQAEEAKKKIEEKADKDFEDNLDKDVKAGKHTVATLTSMKDSETSARRKKTIEAKIVEVSNKTNVANAKSTRVTTTPVTKPTNKVTTPVVTPPSPTRTIEEQTAELIKGFDPTTANLKYKSDKKDSTGDTENAIADTVRSGASSLEDLVEQLDSLDVKFNPELEKLVKLGIHNKLNKTNPVTPISTTPVTSTIQIGNLTLNDLVGKTPLFLANADRKLSIQQNIDYLNEAITELSKSSGNENAILEKQKILKEILDYLSSNKDDVNQSEIDKIDAELAEQFKIINENILGSITPNIMAHTFEKKQVIVAIHKIVELLIKKGFYKFKQILKLLQNRYKGELTPALFNAIKGSYIQEVKDIKAKGGDISQFDNLEEVRDTIFEGNLLESIIDTSLGLGFANLYLGTFDNTKGEHYEMLEDGYKANDYYISNAYKETQGLKIGDKLVITFDHKNNKLNKTRMEDIPLKILVPPETQKRTDKVMNGIQIGWLNDLDNLQKSIDYARSLNDFTTDELLKMWDKVHARIQAGGERLTTKEKLLAYKVKTVTQQQSGWEKAFDVWVEQTLVSNYMATKKLRELFFTGKSSNKVLEVELGNKTGGEFAKIPWTTVGEIHDENNDGEFFIVDPGYANEQDGNNLDSGAPTSLQILTSNKDSKKQFSKVNTDLIYRNLDAQYTPGTIYMLLPTFMSTIGDYTTYTPNPLKITTIDDDNLNRVSVLARKIIKMQIEGTTFENEDFKDLMKQLGYYVNVRSHDAKNKLGVTINVNTIDGVDVSNMTFEFYHKNKRYKAILYAKGQSLNDFGEFTGYIAGSSMVVYEEHIDENGNSVYGKLSDDDSEFTSYTTTSGENKEEFKEQFNKILLSLSRNVNWKLLKSNEGIEGYKTYQEFLNSTNAWKTDVGKVYDDKGEQMGYVTPFGNNKLVVSLNPETAKSVAAKSNSNVTAKDIEDKLKECR